MDLDETDDSRYGGITDRDATLQARNQSQTLGQRPGTLLIREGAVKPRLFLSSYDATTLIEKECSSYDDLWASFQAHPELKSRPTRPHPLFVGLVEAALDRKLATRLPVDARR